MHPELEGVRLAKSRVRGLVLGVAVLLIAALFYLSFGAILAAVGGFLVLEDKPEPSEAVVVLSTGAEYYPRLIEAARLFREGLAQKIVINGDRKTDVLRGLEKQGFKPCCMWYEDSLRILSLLGVPRDRVLTVGVEDAYDTVTEAEAVGKELIKAGVTRITITTSKYHTRRARYIWERRFSNHFSIRTVAARDDPYSTTGWWREGRQIRWVMAEYGAWIYYFWTRMRNLEP